MKTINVPTMKKFAETRPGELMKMAAKENLFAIRFQDEDGSPVIGMLSAKQVPTFQRLSTPDKCILSYGLDWVFEPETGPETWVDNQKYHNVGGVAHITPDGPTINFAPPPNAFGVPAFNLSTLAAENLHLMAPCMRWRIWASEDNMKAGRAPLFEFEAESAPEKREPSYQMLIFG